MTQVISTSGPNSTMSVRSAGSADHESTHAGSV